MKNNLKRIVALLAALALTSGIALSTVSCGFFGAFVEGFKSGFDNAMGNGKDESTPVETPAETPEETPAESANSGSNSAIPEFDYLKEDLTEYVSLGQYKDLTIEVVAKPEISDADVLNQINVDLISLQYCTQVTDRAVTETDTVYISYKGLLDGEEFDGGTGTKDFFTIYDGGGFIDGFAEGLIGAMPGEEVAVELTFPENYYEDLAGKPVTFMVTVGHIYEATELTDALAAEFTGDESMTAETLMSEYRALLEESMNSTYDEYKLDLVWSRIFENATELSIPADIIKSYYDVDVEYYSAYASMYGITYEDILDMIGMTDDDVYNRAHDNVLTDMIVYSIVKAENYTITEEEYDELLAEFSESSGYSKEDILSAYSKDALTEMFTYTKIYEMAVEWQNFVTVEE